MQPDSLILLNARGGGRIPQRGIDLRQQDESDVNMQTWVLPTNLRNRARVKYGICWGNKPAVRYMYLPSTLNGLLSSGVTPRRPRTQQQLMADILPELSFEQGIRVFKRI